MDRERFLFLLATLLMAGTYLYSRHAQQDLKKEVKDARSESQKAADYNQECVRKLNILKASHKEAAAKRDEFQKSLIRKTGEHEEAERKLKEKSEEVEIAKNKEKESEAAINKLKATIDRMKKKNKLEVEGSVGDVETNEAEEYLEAEGGNSEAKEDTNNSDKEDGPAKVEEFPKEK